MKTTPLILAVLSVSSAGFTLSGQLKESPLPHVMIKEGRYALFVESSPDLKTTPLILAVLAVSSAGFTLSAQLKESPLPHVMKKEGRYALFVEGAPFLILGAQANNSSAWPAMLPKVWPAIEYLHANTLEIPVYWEQFEPRPGQFDYSVIDTILAQAHEHRVHLVLLWFGTWKNGSQHYMPEWMKLAPDKY